MWGKRTFILAAIVLTLTSVANADLILTLNGLDAAKESVEIGGKDNIVIAVAGSTEVDPNAYYIKATGGTLEATAVPNTVSPQAYNSKYSFTFEGEAGLGVVSLIANNDMVIDGTSVKEGDTIYELVLFYGSETDTVMAFGVNLESLSYIPTEPEPKPAPEPQPVPELKPEPEAEAQPEPETAPEPQPKAFLPLSEQIIMPYAQRMEQEKAQSLKFCPSGGGLMTATASLPTKEDRGREIRFGDGRGSATMGGRGVIDVDSDITSNQIWTADNTYYVTSQINVQALLVIEPGTVIYFSYDNYAAMFINNGGTLISTGTPDNPIVYTSDAGYGWGDYFCPIYIEETASTCTKVTYSYIEFAQAAIVTNNIRLDTPIENNYLFDNTYGIGEYGTYHTDIKNNLIYDSYYDSIAIYMESDDGMADANSQILIENNTCDYYQDNGITVHGVEDANESGVVVLANNIVSESYWYGLNLVDGYMYAMVLNTGYYGNYMNKNREFEEENPVEANEFPYVEGPGYFDLCYLDQNCPFIDAGLQYIEQTPLIGQTTDVNSIPDYNYVDIGFHYPNWNFENAGDGSTLDWDLTGNLAVDFKDFAIFANGWQTTYDVNDLAAFTGEWLESISGHPQISITISGDPCNLSGDIEIGVSGYGYQTEQAFVLVDGQFFGEIFGFDDGYGVELETYSFGNGQHTIKIVTVDPNNIITVSPPAVVTFNNKLSYMTGSDDFDPCCDYHLGAMYSGECGLIVKVLDMDENIVWSDTHSGNISVSIPAETFSGNGFYDIVVEETCSESWVKKVGKTFKPNETNPNTKGLIICPDRKVTEAKFEKAIKKSIEAFEQKGIEYAVLYCGNATYANMAFCLTELPVKHLYFVGHANYQVGDRLRTVIKLSDGRVVSYKLSDFDPNNIPPFCEDMGKWEKKAKSIAAMGIPVGKLKIVFFDACYSARLKITAGGELVEGPSYEEDPTEVITDVSPSDMSWALGVEYSDQIYKGWYDLSYAERILTYYNDWSGNFWKKLGGIEGISSGSIYEAVNYCIWHTPGVELKKGPFYNYRFKGAGGDIYSIRLTN